MLDIFKKCVDYVYLASKRPALVDPLETLETGLSYVFPERKRIPPSVATSSARSMSPGKATLLTTGLGPKREERYQKLQNTSLKETQTQIQGDDAEVDEQIASGSRTPEDESNSNVPDPQVDAEDSGKRKKTSLKETQTQAQVQGDGAEDIEQTASRPRKRKAKNDTEAHDPRVDAGDPKRHKKASPEEAQAQAQGDGAEAAEQSRKRKAKNTREAPDAAESSKKRKKTSEKGAQGDSAEGAKQTASQSRKRKAQNTPEAPEAPDRKRKARRTRDNAEGSKSHPGPDYVLPVFEIPVASKERSKKAFRHRPPELSDFQVAYKWFHLVRRMVMKEHKSDYILECAFMPYALVVMVYEGWIDLLDVLGWTEARHLYGEGLVKLFTERDRCQKLQVLVDIDKPSKQETSDFQMGWTISTDPDNKYDWEKDVADRKKYGPFGPAPARYATPEILEDVLAMQFRDTTQLRKDKARLPEILKPLFSPLFLRNLMGWRGTNEQKHQEIPEDDSRKRHARQTTVEDAPEDTYVEPRVGGCTQDMPILEVRENETNPVSPPPAVVDPANQSVEMRTDEVESAFAIQPDVVNGVPHGHVWANQPIYPPFQAQTYKTANVPSDVHMDAEVIRQQALSHNGGLDNTQADSDMSFDFTGPPQIVGPQLGNSPVTGPGEDAVTYGTYMSSGKRVKCTVDTSQAPQSQFSQSHTPQPQFSQPQTSQPHTFQFQIPQAQVPQVQTSQFQAPQIQAPQVQTPVAQTSVTHPTSTRPTQTQTQTYTAQPRTSSTSPSAANPARRGARPGGQARPRQRPRDRHIRAATSYATTNQNDPVNKALAGLPMPNFG